jgi:hypothetical protein
MAQISFKTSLHLDKGLLSSQGLPNLSDALPLATEKFVPSNLNYIAQVDQIFKSPGVDRALDAWAQPSAAKPELFEPTRFTDTLVEVKQVLKVLIAQANTQDAPTFKKLNIVVEDDVNLRGLVKQMQMTLFEG